MATKYHTIAWGETLWSIAAANNTTVDKLVELNNIKNPDLIIEGEKIIVSGDAKTETKTTTSYVEIERFGLQNNSQRNVYVTWAWTKNDTDHYQVKWYYYTGSGPWFVGSDSTTKEKQSLYGAPENAVGVKVKIKPVIKDGVTGSAKWTSGWVTSDVYYFSKNPLTKPEKPSVTMEDYTLTAKLTGINIGTGAAKMEFAVYKLGSTDLCYSGTANIVNSAASMSWKVAAGCEYVVQCRAIKSDGSKSPYSDYSDPVGSAPAATKGITTIKAYSKTSVLLEWATSKTAKRYDLQYADDKNLLNSSDAATTIQVESTSYIKTGLEAGKEYFFRVRAVNDSGESAWSEIKSIIIGLKPSAPTSWSSATTVIVGESLYLYWVHNTEDGSKARSADIEITYDGVSRYYYMTYANPDDTDADMTYSYSVDTLQYREGASIQWRVRTKGISDEYSEWSTPRIVDIYARPSLAFNVIDGLGNVDDIMASFPINIGASSGPDTQKPVSYHVTIKSNELYETVDAIGNPKAVGVDEVVYSKYLDTDQHTIAFRISACDVTLENGVSYTITCVVAMDSGLTAEVSKTFDVSLTSEAYEPNAEIAIDKNALVAFISPYCMDENDEYIPGVSLAVYRREFDGKFTELAKGLVNGEGTFVVDPHPALDLARYRIVATTNATGAVSYFDIPGIEVGEHAVVLHWDEQWSWFDTLSEADPEQPPWSGSMLKLPYNIDVSDSLDKDVELIEYIGRSHPVSYYGTQLGESSTWNVDIAKSDKETLYALRRLAKWTGDVYVREPSGSGYWASINVSFSQTHCENAVPVTIDITRVEGGI